MQRTAANTVGDYLEAGIAKSAGHRKETNALYIRAGSRIDCYRLEAGAAKDEREFAGMHIAGYTENFRETLTR